MMSPFQEAFKTVLKDDLILSVNIPFSRPGQVMRYYRRARRKNFDLPVANAALMAILDTDGKLGNVRIVAGMV